MNCHCICNQIAICMGGMVKKSDEDCGGGAGGCTDVPHICDITTW